jgi:16S rRNA (guanine966-N2)-methyltransferase
MRIISGIYGGRIIKTISASSTRPTADRVREAMSSSIVSHFGDMSRISVFDAFAGSGALGFEMLSRGAAYATFVETNRRALTIIRSNAAELEVSPSLMFSYGEDVCTLARRKTILQGAPFGLVMLDPPYAFPEQDVCQLLEDLSMGGNLEEDALIVYEHGNNAFCFKDSSLARRHGVPTGTGGFVSLSKKRYGITEIDYLGYQKEEQ